MLFFLSPGPPGTPLQARSVPPPRAASPSPPSLPSASCILFWEAVAWAVYVRESYASNPPPRGVIREVWEKVKGESGWPERRARGGKEQKRQEGKVANWWYRSPGTVSSPQGGDAFGWWGGCGRNWRPSAAYHPPPPHRHCSSWAASGRSSTGGGALKAR